MSRYQVTGPLALVKDQNRKVSYYYDGAILPDDIAIEERDRLVSIGLVSEVDDDGIVIKRDESPIPEQLAVIDETPAAPRPLNVAPKSTWDDYAVSQGMERKVVQAMSKAELVDRYPVK